MRKEPATLRYVQVDRSRFPAVLFCWLRGEHAYVDAVGVAVTPRSGFHTERRCVNCERRDVCQAPCTGCGERLGGFKLTTMCSSCYAELERRIFRARP